MPMRASVTAAIALVALLAAPSPVRAEENPEEIARGLKDLLRIFDGIDTDASGGLSREELPVEDVFTSLDADGDGFLTKSELQVVLDQVEATLAEKRKAAEAANAKKKETEKNREKKPEPPPGTMEEDAPAPGENPWTTERLKTLLATDPRFDADARVREFLRNFDRDPKDGKVERKEYAGGDGDPVFRKYDRTRDGALEERELRPLMKSQIEDLWRARKSPSRAEFVYLYDLDLDGFVTRDEFAALRGPASYFRDYDVDGNDRVNYEEVIYPERYRRPGASNLASRPETPKPVSRSPWEMLDKDGDNRISLDEFGGNETVFRRLDRNGDGYLTLHDA